MKKEGIQTRNRKLSSKTKKGLSRHPMAMPDFKPLHFDKSHQFRFSAVPVHSNPHGMMGYSTNIQYPYSIHTLSHSVHPSQLQGNMDHLGGSSAMLQSQQATFSGFSGQSMSGEWESVLGKPWYVKPTGSMALMQEGQPHTASCYVVWCSTSRKRVHPFVLWSVFAVEHLFSKHFCDTAGETNFLCLRKQVSSDLCAVAFSNLSDHTIFIVRRRSWYRGTRL